MLLFEVNELGLKARLSALLYPSFKHTISYLISFPLMRGEGWDGGGHHRSFPPTLILPLCGGRKSFFWLNWGYTFQAAQKGTDITNCFPLISMPS